MVNRYACHLMHSASNLKTRLTKKQATFRSACFHIGTSGISHLSKSSIPTFLSTNITATALWFGTARTLIPPTRWTGIAKATRALLLLFCQIHSKRPALQIIPIEHFDSFHGRWFIDKFHKSESSWTTGIPVGWD